MISARMSNSIAYEVTFVIVAETIADAGEKAFEKLRFRLRASCRNIKSIPWLSRDGISTVAAEASAAVPTHKSVTIQGDTPAFEEIEEGQRACGNESEISSEADCWQGLVGFSVGLGCS